MHTAVTDFINVVKDNLPHRFEDQNVLEVGSRYINGTVRTQFTRCRYHGLDLSPGPLVDEVCHVADFPGEALFDVVVSCEALEHDKRWADSLRAMLRLLKPGGMLLITCAGPGRPEHGTTRTSPGDSPATTDYYGNIDQEMFFSAVPYQNFEPFAILVKDGDLHFWGVKR